jgi:hypothetical protein
MPLIPHPQGQYLFLPGIAPYSCGAVSAPGFEIAHVTLHRPTPYRQGFDLIENHLEREGRPKAALCGVELRSPRPFTFQGFAEFNAEYASMLKDWGLFVDGINPVARTNVAPGVKPRRRTGPLRVLVLEGLQPRPVPDFRSRRGGRTPRGYSRS